MRREGIERTRLREEGVDALGLAAFEVVAPVGRVLERGFEPCFRGRDLSGIDRAGKGGVAVVVESLEKFVLR